MLKLRYGRHFKKDFKKSLKRKGQTVEKFKTVLEYLVNEKPLPEQYADHKLNGKYEGYRECHIMPDWLLIYRVEETTVTLILLRTGSHSDLFE